MNWKLLAKSVAGAAVVVCVLLLHLWTSLVIARRFGPTAASTYYIGVTVGLAATVGFYFTKR